MYNEKLEKLIEAALVDGELSEKEKQVLFKKAEELGIDLDEFEMVLQAKLFEKQKDKKNVSAAPKSDKLGDIKKCPACGAIAESFATKCSNCGTEFRNVEASQNIIKFFEKLERIDSDRYETLDENVKDEEHEGLFSKLYENLFKEPKWTTIDVRKEELIINFPIPVSKEEILEFLTLAASKIESISFFEIFSEQAKYKNKWNKVWIKKIDQIYTKSSFALKEDKQTFEEISKIVEESKRVIKKNDDKIFITKVLAIVIPVLLLVGLYGGILFYEYYIKRK